MNINPRTEEAYVLFHKGILALARAEQQGLRVDLTYIERKSKQLTKKIEILEEQFKSTPFYRHWEHTVKGRINIYSNTQLAHFLYDIKKIKVEKETVSGQGATDDEALRQMGIPELEDLLQMRKLKKVRDTYLDAFYREQVNGYLHPFFNLHLVTTFRSSSNSPNFQNIPKRDEESMQICRRSLFPRPGHQLLEADLSGTEVRVAACYHKDPTMLKYIKNPASDIHADMAKQIFIIDRFDKSIPEHYVLRQAAKNGFVFPEFYGDYYKNCAFNMACLWGKLSQGRWSAGQGIAMPEGTLSDHLISKGIKSLDAFSEHLKKIETDFWGKRFADYAEWKDRWYNVYKKYGYFDTLTGFRCQGVMGKKEVINYPVQGSAFHCLLWIFIELDRIMQKEKWDSKLIGQIHDSVIMDVLPSELEHVVKTIKKVCIIDLPNAWEWLIVPIDVDIEISPVDGSWAEKSKLKT
jgi:DNA polymerase I-like protein with 3'-5' exonuclease and polymerase domains